MSVLLEARPIEAMSPLPMQRERLHAPNTMSEALQGPDYPALDAEFLADIENSFDALTAISPSTVQHAGYLATRSSAERRLFDTAPISEDQRVLTEINNLNRHRLPDGSIPAWVYDAVLKNQITAVKEAAIPHAVSKIFQDYVLTGEFDGRGRPIGTYMWLGKTAIEVAESGFAFYQLEESRARGVVEIDEATHNDSTMREGYAKVFLSPKDEKLKEDHLGADDALRISYLGVSEEGKEGKCLESILVRDVPLEAWEAMLADPNNIWGKAIPVEQSNSPLSIMKTHRQLEIPLDRLPEGVVSLLVAVAPYIHDSKARASVEQQIMLFRGDQQVISEQATNIARRWMDFELSLAESVANGRATGDIERFINQLQNQWSKKDIALFNAHRLADGSLSMSEELAARLERAKQNLLWTAAGVITGNEAVLSQMSKDTAQQIRDQEILIQKMMKNGASTQEIMSLEVKNNQAIAKQNVKVGGGCPGENKGGFGDEEEGPDNNSENKKNWKLKKGPCRTKSCPNHKKIVTVGPCDVCMDRCQKIYDDGGDPGSRKQFSLAA